jgi:hypothetical protein
MQRRLRLATGGATTHVQRVACGGHGAPGLGQESLPGGGHGDAPAGTSEQGRAEFALQAADLFADRLLGDVHPGGGSPEVQFVGDGQGVFDTATATRRPHAPRDSEGIDRHLRRRRLADPAGCDRS